MVNREIQQTGGASTETAQSRVSVWWMRMVMGVVRSFVRPSVRCVKRQKEQKATRRVEKAVSQQMWEIA